jgi:hypothetical protein
VELESVTMVCDTDDNKCDEGDGCGGGGASMELKRTRSFRSSLCSNFEIFERASRVPCQSVLEPPSTLVATRYSMCQSWSPKLQLEMSKCSPGTRA